MDELQLRCADVDQRPELVDVAIAIAVQRDEGRQVQRRVRELRRKRTRRVREVVVAVDEDARVAIRYDLANAVDGDVREAEIDRPADVQFIELLRAAGIEHDRVRFAAHADEFLFREDRKSTRLNSSHSQISYAV